MKIVFVVAIIALLLLDTVVIVHTNETAIIERLGSKHKIVSNRGERILSGITFKAPIIDRVVDRISLKDQHQDYHPRDMITLDNVRAIVDLIVYFRKKNIYQYYYGVEKPLDALQEMAYSTLRPIIGSMRFDEILKEREKINNQMLSNLGNTNRLGVEVIGVDIQDVQPIDPAFRDAMDKEAVAERERRATETKAEGEAKARVTIAKADKEAMIQKAEANARVQKIKYETIAAGMQMIKDAGGTAEDAFKVQQLDTMAQVANGTATKIVIPSDLPEMAAITSAAMVAKTTVQKQDDQ